METLTLDILQTNLDSARKFRERRHPQWTDNYQLYRDTVITNRLTERQSVNVPLMKETLRTALAKTDELDQLYFRNRDNDRQRELYCNEYWKDVIQSTKLELLDIIDKKQEYLYGRSFMMLNIRDGRLQITVEDPQDIAVDRYADPWDLDSAGFIVHTGIFRRIETLEQNPLYDKKALNRLRVFYGTKAGLIKAEQNAQALQDKNRRLEEMGVSDINNPILGQTYVEIHQHLVKVWNSSEKKFEIIVCVIADGQQILMQKPLKDVLGIDFYPYTSWAEDIERTDFWSDGLADVIRVPNQILNVWLSQLVENRTLRNFGMQFYNAKADENWRPSPMAPTPFAWFPLPGKPDEILKRVDIPDLSESLDEMRFLIEMGERASAASGIEKGTREAAKKTLGEIELLAARAEERITSSVKYSRLARKELGEKAVRLVSANADKMKPLTLYKQNAKGDFYPKNLKMSEIVSRSGYEVEVTTVAEKQRQDIESLQKMKLAAAQFPTNVPLQKIAKRKTLDFVGLSADETKEVMDFEEQHPPANPMMLPPGMMGGAPTGVPVERPMMAPANV